MKPIICLLYLFHSDPHLINAVKAKIVILSSITAGITRKQKTTIEKELKIMMDQNLLGAILVIAEDMRKTGIITAMVMGGDTCVDSYKIAVAATYTVVVMYMAILT